jgi:hypothetical protein
MELPYIDNLKLGGFNFDNTLRNDAIMEKGGKEPVCTKTGTTIVGVVYKDGVIMASDTRAFAGPIVGDKNCIIWFQIYGVHDVELLLTVTTSQRK